MSIKSKDMDFKNLKDLFTHFANDEICRTYLEGQRWGGQIVCPYCQHSGKIYRIENGKRYKCGNAECHKKFSVTVGTIFESSKIDLRTWFGAMYLCTAHKKGISSLQLHRDLGVTQKTAWFMLQRIREMLRVEAPQMLKNTVESDETYIGGKEKNKHSDKRTKGLQGGKGKAMVVGMIERGGDLIAKHVDNKEGSVVEGIVEAYVEKGSNLMTDDAPAYVLVGSRNYVHRVVNHSAKQYVDGMCHTNTIEGFWSLLKRGIVGIYHSVSVKHLSRYCDEFSYRYNTRKISDVQRFHFSVKRVSGKRLRYAEVTAKQRPFQRVS